MNLTIRLALALLVLVLTGVNYRVVASQRAVDEHVAAAKAAAGEEYKALFDRLCTPPPPRRRGRNRQRHAAAAPRPPVPDRAEWHAEPVKVFDNLYFVGTREHSAWAVVTSAGIIVIDPLYAYAVEDEVVGGLKKVGLNPADIKYVLVSHGHGDHSGGAGYLQDRFNAHVILAAPDWDLLERNTRDTTKPKRDMIATDGQQADARRHDADLAPDARSHTRHHLDADSGARRIDPSPCRDLGRHGLQLPADATEFRDVHRVGGEICLDCGKGWRRRHPVEPHGV